MSLLNVECVRAYLSIFFSLEHTHTAAKKKKIMNIIYVFLFFIRVFEGHREALSFEQNIGKLYCFS